MPKNSIRAVGNSTYTLTHSLVNGGNPVNLTGIRLDVEYLVARQQIDSSKVVLMIDGSAVTITNTALAGMLTITCTDTGLDIADGNIIAIIKSLLQSGDSVGGQIRVATTTNGVVQAITLLGVTFKIGDIIRLAGNDVPNYPVEWNYQGWQPS